MIVKLILQNFDMPDTDIVTAKQGDIVNVVPDDAIHADEGKVVRRIHLIIKVDLGSILTKVDHIKALRVEHFNDNRLWFGDMDKISIIQKRRYKIPWDELLAKAQARGISIDMKQLLDETIDYQPLEKEIFPITDLVHDKVLNKKIGSKEFKDISDEINLGPQKVKK